MIRLVPHALIKVRIDGNLVETTAGRVLFNEIYWRMKHSMHFW